MRLKTFFAPTMAEAMLAVRRGLGENALILSTLEEEDGVRLTAAVEALPTSETQEPPPPSGSLDPEAVLAQLSRCFLHHGVPEPLAQTLLFKASQDKAVLREGLVAVFNKLFAYHPLSFEFQGPSLITLVGLTGAGKSVTTAKLAAEALLAGLKVELVTLDVHKAGALEQLSAYANIMNIPLHVARSPEDLSPHVEKAEQGIQVFVDTPGVNPFSEEDMSFLSDCIFLTKQAPFWVMPAGGDAQETLEAAEAFKNIGVTDFFQTRSDSARRYGALLAVLGEGNLRLSGLSAGPTVGNRLIPGSGAALHDVLDGDQFKVTVHKKEQKVQKKKPVEPEWLIRLREAKA